ncbi:hypothetical protein DNTS_020239 [Danionella cerebrum]|uniref:EGF-like domain-containing protein n=1 Tax=Danionella cerebrum TaxID=2873325 RepID=A0A553PWL5_9TELE|nr:hypothetical protein DNTS_020239 [Danionella translucida]
MVILFLYLKPCANGGQCVLHNNTSYSCVCAPGWTGPTCSVNKNECVQHRCQNGATCIDEIAGYRETVLCICSCLCGHGYSGALCELEIDFCSGHLCSEHSVCLDQQHNYTCHCMLGYEGKFCELETDECKSAPCANNATCIDLVGGYHCLCAPGFQGRTCSENMNECWSRPCLNGGTCIDLVNDYICICPIGKKQTSFLSGQVSLEATTLTGDGVVLGKLISKFDELSGLPGKNRDVLVSASSYIE